VCQRALDLIPRTPSSSGFAGPVDPIGSLVSDLRALSGVKSVAHESSTRETKIPLVLGVHKFVMGSKMVGQ